MDSALGLLAGDTTGVFHCTLVLFVRSINHPRLPTSCEFVPQGNYLTQGRFYNNMKCGILRHIRWYFVRDNGVFHRATVRL